MQAIINSTLSKDTPLKLTDTNVFDHLEMATKYQFDNIVPACFQFIESILSTSTALYIFHQSHRLSQLELREKSLKFCLWYAEDVCQRVFKHVSINSIDVDTWCRFLSHDEINVSSEKIVLDVIMRLCQMFRMDEKDKLKLLKCVRFGILSEEELNNFRSIITNISPTNDEDIFGKEIVSYSHAQRQVPLVPCVVGINKRENKLYLFKIDEEKKDIISFLDLHKAFGNQAGYPNGVRVCAVGPKIFIIGGEYNIGRGSWNSDIWSYSTVTEEWNCEWKMLPVRRHMSICVWNGSIILAGGFSAMRVKSNSVQRINIDEEIIQSIEDGPDLPDHVSSSGMCVFEKQLYVIKNRVFILSTWESSWREVCFNEKGQDFMAAVATDSHIYLVSQHKSELHRFDPKKVNDDGRFELEYVGNFLEEAQNLLYDGKRFIYNITSEMFGTNSIVEVLDKNMDTKDENRFQTIITKKNESIEFCSYTPVGCFYLVIY